MLTLTDHATATQAFLDATVTGDLEALAEITTDDVIGWSPNLFVTSQGELLDALQDREDAVSIVAVLADITVVGDKAFAEWRVEAEHTGTFADDDLIIEGSGRLLHLAGASVVEFDGYKVSSFRHYFDDLALLEQLLATD